MKTSMPPTAAVSLDIDLLAQAFTRAAGAQLISGNSVRLLKDGAANYPAWLEAIHGAREKIYFENYFVSDDEIGVQFASALATKAREGVRVRVIHDWLGSLQKTPAKFWRSLLNAGVEVRCFNPPRMASPLGWLNRDHRKMLAVDSRIGFVTGLCVDRAWLGNATKGIEPWRDTGVEIKGPALLEIERAFGEVWSSIGDPLPAAERHKRDQIADEGSVALRIVANAPGDSAIFRIDQLIAAAARHTLWLTDAYFAGIPPYIQALRAAALDGVDVRLLVPGASDIALLRPLSQAGYRPLLEAGIRVFEWNGSMLHAKTAVADGKWARVGSTNLNVASWIGNYELDAIIEDTGFASQMEEMYASDLDNATEITLRARRRRLRPTLTNRSGLRGRRRASLPSMGSGNGSASRATAGALRLSRTMGAALTQQRVLAPTEGGIVAGMGVAVFVFALASLFVPYLTAIPIAAVLLWIALALLMRARELRRERRTRGLPTTRLTETGTTMPAKKD